MFQMFDTKFKHKSSHTLLTWWLKPLKCVSDDSKHSVSQSNLMYKRQATIPSQTEMGLRLVKLSSATTSTIEKVTPTACDSALHTSIV